jgi:DNA-binding PadR family transcriptional regulator
MTENSRRARYYKLTRAGREQLRAESARLVDQLDAVITILNANTAK